MALQRSLDVEAILPLNQTGAARRAGCASKSAESVVASLLGHAYSVFFGPLPHPLVPEGQRTMSFRDVARFGPPSDDTVSGRSRTCPTLADWLIRILRKAGKNARARHSMPPARSGGRAVPGQAMQPARCENPKRHGGGAPKKGRTGSERILECGAGGSRAHQEYQCCLNVNQLPCLGRFGVSCRHE